MVPLEMAKVCRRHMRDCIFLALLGLLAILFILWFVEVWWLCYPLVLIYAFGGAFITHNLQQWIKLEKRWLDIHRMQRELRRPDRSP